MWLSYGVDLQLDWCYVCSISVVRHPLMDNCIVRLLSALWVLTAYYLLLDNCCWFCGVGDISLLLNADSSLWLTADNPLIAN